MPIRPEQVLPNVSEVIGDTLPDFVAAAVDEILKYNTWDGWCRIGQKQLFRVTNAMFPARPICFIHGAMKAYYEQHGWRVDEINQDEQYWTFTDARKPVETGPYWRSFVID